MVKNMEINMKKIGKRLKQLRANNNYTQQQVSNYLEIDQSHLSNIELGKRKLTLTILNKLCNLYNCSNEYVLGKTNEYMPPKIAFKGNKNNIELKLVADMNKTMKNLQYLRKKESELNEQ